MDDALYIDIETIPGQAPGIKEELAKGISAPGQYKKAESIAEWEREQKPAAVEEAWLKTSFNGAFGEIVVVSFALGDDKICTLPTGDWKDPESEKALLISLNEALNEVIFPSGLLLTTVVGHNVSAFDLRFLLQRCIVKGVRPHPIIKRAAQARPWEADKVYDTMVQWAGVSGSISLDKLCKALGMPGKGDMDGSKVWPAVRDGNISKVIEYCPDDVAKVRSIHKRMTFQG